LIVVFGVALTGRELSRFWELLFAALIDRDTGMGIEGAGSA
jgi:hypothetical protein